MRGRFWVAAGLVVSLGFGAGFPIPGGTEPVILGEDDDVMLVPAGMGQNPPGRDFQATSLRERGLTVLPVLNLAMPRYETRWDQMAIQLRPGEGAQFVSEAIPVSSDTVFVTCRIAKEGENPIQTALAVWDYENPSHLGVSIQTIPDGGPEFQELSLEFSREGLQAVQVLAQLVGPRAGESNLSLDRFRLIPGFSEQNYTMGAVSLLSQERKKCRVEQPVVHRPPSTAGGYCLKWEGEPSLLESQVETSGWRIGTRNPEDVIQIKIPIPAGIEWNTVSSYPARIYATVMVRRLVDAAGVLSIAFFSGVTQNGGYRDYPLELLAEDSWSPIRIPVPLEQRETGEVMLIVQVRGGPAEIELGEFFLEARRDSRYVWKASRLDAVEFIW